jgi:hypothetical protein
MPEAPAEVLALVRAQDRTKDLLALPKQSKAWIRVSANTPWDCSARHPMYGKMMPFLRHYSASRLSIVNSIGTRPIA